MQFGLNIVGSILTLAGMLLMYNYSVTNTQFSGYWNDELLAQAKAANGKRQRMQRIGLAVSVAGVVVLAAANLLPAH